MMNVRRSSLLILCVLLAAPLRATIFGTVRGIAHDPDHRPVADANVTVQSLPSEYKKTGKTDPNGQVDFSGVPAGDDRGSITRPALGAGRQSGVLSSVIARVRHLQ